jgi:hypothetical protein
MSQPKIPGFTDLKGHVHVYSVFGRWCYLCRRRKHWWAFWEKWKEEEHDEPF